MQTRFTVAEVAEMLRVSNDTVYGMIKEGKLNALRAGRQYIITRSQLIEYAGSEDNANDLIQALDPDDADDDVA